MNSYFVTGATGFIGSRLVNALEGNIRVLSRTRHVNHETVICDLNSEPVPAKILEGVDTVFHLAGIAHDVEGVHHNQEDLYYKVNVKATIDLAKLAAESNVKNFVFVSSVKASTKGCVNANDQGLYGITKKEAELRLLEIGRESNMHIAIIRSSLVYGPGVKGNLQLMLSGIKKGWFPPLPETGNKRSMVHVDDLVRAILLVAQDHCSDQGVFTVTDGVEYSARDIYIAMCGAAEEKPRRWTVPKIAFNIVSLISPKAKYRINKLFGNEYYSSKEIEALGFKPQKTLKDIGSTDF